MFSRMFDLLRAPLFSRKSVTQDEDCHAVIIVRRVRELLELMPHQDVVNGALGTYPKETSSHQHRESAQGLE